MTIDCRLFPARLNFPAAVNDVGHLTGDEEVVRLTGDAAGFGRLPEHRALRTLWCIGIDGRRLAILARCDSLESLYIEDVRVRDLEPLAALRRVQVLSIDGATRVESLSWLRRFRSLSQLRLQHFPRVSTLDPISVQHAVVALDVSGSMWTRMSVESFRPLADLTELRSLYLTNIVSLDGSIQPFAELKQLRELYTANFYSWQEFATLAGVRPDIECSWFKPLTELPFQLCETCRSSLVMLTGRRQPRLCPRCDAGRVQRHEERFMELKRKAGKC
jgi:hypothetical protein